MGISVPSCRDSKLPSPLKLYDIAWACNILRPHCCAGLRAQNSDELLVQRLTPLVRPRHCSVLKTISMRTLFYLVAQQYGGAPVTWKSARQI